MFSTLRPMPDNTRPPRNARLDDPPNLGTRALMRAIDELAKARGVADGRVATKRNAKGERSGAGRRSSIRAGRSKWARR